MIPGEIDVDDSLPAPSPGTATVVSIDVRNRGDRPIQVGSHYHLFEVNPALEFDRETAYGMRLAIPAGTSVRFEPGEVRRVEATPLGGARRAIGFRGMVQGDLDDPRIREAALARVRNHLAATGP